MHMHMCMLHVHVHAHVARRSREQASRRRHSPRSTTHRRKTHRRPLAFSRRISEQLQREVLRDRVTALLRYCVTALILRYCGWYRGTSRYRLYCAWLTEDGLDSPTPSPRTVSSRFPPPLRLSSPVRYRTCGVIGYVHCVPVCVCKGGFVSRAPSAASPVITNLRRSRMPSSRASTAAAATPSTRTPTPRIRLFCVCLPSKGLMVSASLAFIFLFCLSTIQHGWPCGAQLSVLRSVHR